MPDYNLLGRRVETDLLPQTRAEGVGVIAFCPMASGLLTGRFLDGDIPQGARGLLWPGAWVRAHSQEQRSHILTALDAIARRRGQTLAQMALAWVLRGGRVTSALVGASRPEQIVEAAGALGRPDFAVEELAAIDRIAVDLDVNLWARSAERAGPER